MAVYSNSKLRAFEQCPLQFRFRYLDRLPSDLESIEAFTGKRAHETLEWLHGRVQEGAVPTLEETLGVYGTRWDASWHPLVHTVRRNMPPETYRRRGSRCVEHYYRGNWPFDADRTLALEAKIRFPLDPVTQVMGYIDRVAEAGDGTLLVHDYKTGSYMPRREELVSDLQLAIYHLGAVRRWPEHGTPRLVWHFLTFGRKVTVALGDTIERQRRELERRVAAVETAQAADGPWEASVSRLCDWCAYRPVCPAHGGDPERRDAIVLAEADRPAGGREGRRRSGGPATTKDGTAPTDRTEQLGLI
jgi:putative RecB family exonuclease